MGRHVIGNTNPGYNWTPRLEALLSGSYGFEVLGSFPAFISEPEWSKSRLQGDFSSVGQNIFAGASWGSRLAPSRGTANWKRISGVTQDATGSPLGGCFLMLYKTSDRSFQASLLSEADGVYAFGVPELGETYYVVAYKASAPDVFGTTVNALVGS